MGLGSVEFGVGSGEGSREWGVGSGESRSGEWGGDWGLATGDLGLVGLINSIRTLGLVLWTLDFALGRGEFGVGIRVERRVNTGE